MSRTDSEIVLSATDKTGKAFKSVKNNIQGVSGLLSGTASKLAALAGVGGFGLLVKSSLDTVDALAKTSDKLGVTTERLQAMHHATSLFTSASAPALNEALTKATKRLGEFNQTGGGAAAQWLKELQLDTKELASLSPDKLFEKYADSIRGLNDRGKQMAALSALMGDESRQLIGLIDAGKDVFSDAEKELDAFGIAISRVDAAKIEMANDSWTKTKKLISGLGDAIATNLAPVLTALNNKIIDVAKQSGGMGNFVQKAMDSVVTAVGWVLDAINGLKVAFLGLKAAVATVVASIIENLNNLAEPINYLVELLPGVDASPLRAMDDVVKSLNNTANEMGEAFFDALNKAPPSEGLKKGYQELTYEIQKAAEAQAKLVSDRNVSNIENTGSAGGDNKATRDDSSKEFDAAQQRLKVIQESFMTERQLLDEHLAQKQFDIEADFNSGYIKEQERNQALAMLTLQHNAEITRIEDEASQKRIAIHEAEKQAKLNVARGIFGNLSTLMQSGSKRVFEIGKAAAKASVIVDGIRAVQSSYAAGAKIGGPVLGGIFAGTAAAAAAIQLQKLNSTNFDGGGSISASGSGGGNVGSIGSGAGPGGQLQPVSRVQPSRTKVTVLGAKAGQLIDSADLAAALREASDADELIIEVSGERARVY
jgi:hypothetical protein